ncbi:hypothetical protein BDW72DRAFT_29 [Aspergillus terricola var. indicus]
MTFLSQGPRNAACKSLSFNARGLCHLPRTLLVAFLVVHFHPCPQAAACMDCYGGYHESLLTAAMSHYRAWVDDYQSIAVNMTGGFPVNGDKLDALHRLTTTRLRNSVGLVRKVISSL